MPCFAIYFMLKMDKNQLFNDHKEVSFRYICGNRVAGRQRESKTRLLLKRALMQDLYYKIK